ncbi:MAG TPA: hypothetical protein EYM95_07180 [Candidatus Obscuribacterales bacterium]|nr:hypothetical protein [Candidatus Obscuribacterales bacterium]
MRNEQQEQREERQDLREESQNRREQRLNRREMWLDGQKEHERIAGTQGNGPPRGFSGRKNNGNGDRPGRSQ